MSHLFSIFQLSWKQPQSSNGRLNINPQFICFFYLTFPNSGMAWLGCVELSDLYTVLQCDEVYPFSPSLATFCRRIGVLPLGSVMLQVQLETRCLILCKA